MGVKVKILSQSSRLI